MIKDRIAEYLERQGVKRKLSDIFTGCQKGGAGICEDLWPIF
jgi:hypothetical protein